MDQWICETSNHNLSLYKWMILNPVEHSYANCNNRNCQSINESIGVTRMCVVHLISFESSRWRGHGGLKVDVLLFGIEILIICIIEYNNWINPFPLLSYCCWIKLNEMGIPLDERRTSAVRRIATEWSSGWKGFLISKKIMGYLICSHSASSIYWIRFMTTKNDE